VSRLRLATLRARLSQRLPDPAQHLIRNNLGVDTADNRQTAHVRALVFCSAPSTSDGTGRTRANFRRRRQR
jgi:hypothetical protein